MVTNALISETVNSLARYIGSLFPFFFFGIFTIQVYTYFQAFPNDKLAIKVLVCTLYAIALAQIALFVHDGFDVFGPGFGDVAGVFVDRNNWLSALMFDGIVACCVQVFYAWRIFVVSKIMCPSILIVLLSLTSIVPCFIAGVRLELHHEVEGYSGGRSATLIWLGTSVACDILNAGFTIFYVKCQFPKGSGVQSTMNKVNRIVLLTVQTGTLTAGFTIVALVILAIPKLAFYSYIVLSSTSGIYSTTFMSLLNSRMPCSVNAHGNTHENGARSDGVFSVNNSRALEVKEGQLQSMRFAPPSESVVVNVVDSQVSIGSIA